MGVGGWELGWVVVCHGSLGPFHNKIPNSNTNEGGVRDTKSIPIVIFLIRYIKSILGWVVLDGVRVWLSFDTNPRALG